MRQTADVPVLDDQSHLRGRPALAALLVAAALLTAACGGEAGTVTAAGVRVLVGESTSEGMDALLTGRLADVGGCLGIEPDETGDAMAVVWPHGTEVVDDAPLTIEVPDDGRYAIGDTVSLAGGTVAGGEVGGLPLPPECSGEQTWLSH